MTLAGKTIVVGITGSISAYKAADIVARLMEGGAKVEVIMTEAAMKLINPATLQTLARRPVITDMFAPVREWSAAHIALAEAADVVLIAPATANTIAKIVYGLADNIVTSTVLATKSPVIIAPAMNVNMYENTVTQQNIARLKERGVVIVDPGYGRLASGKIGKGRLAEIDQIVGIVKQVLGRGGDLAGKKVLVTAGGTREAIDPVRVISNRSSGKMGYAIAEAARDRGATVTLLTAPTSLPAPAGMQIINVETALQMKEAVIKEAYGADAIIMAAAVADYRPKTVSGKKIKKSGDTLALELVRTPDIIGEVSGNLIKVGFAAESEDLVENARKKLKSKKLDIIVANNITDAGSGFGSDTNKVTIIAGNGKEDNLPLLTKREVADKILDKVVERLKAAGKAVAASNSDSFETVVKESYLNSGWINIPATYKNLFPDADDTEVQVETAKGVFDAVYRRYPKYQGFTGMKKWFNKMGIKANDRLVIKVLVPMKKYRIEVKG